MIIMFHVGVIERGNSTFYFLGEVNKGEKMKKIIFLLVLMLIPGLVFAEAQKGSVYKKRKTVYDKISPASLKETQVVTPMHIAEPVKIKIAAPISFQVTEVNFETVEVEGQTRLVAAVMFNKDIDSATVEENLNIRLLKQDDQGFWRDASTQNNHVNVRPSFITWVSGASLEGGLYKMHLRGTIQSADGLYLDCDGDGTGERGNLPAYESQVYQSELIELDPMEDGDLRGESLEDLFGG